jgi:drug/metabolite transporter (DMT)-like permease
LGKWRRFLPILAGLVISFIFGFSFLFSKQSLASMTPLELLAHRFSLASVLLLILIFLKIIKVNLSFNLIRDLLPIACFQPVIYFLGETYGIKLTTASESGLIVSLIPVAVTLMSRFFLKEKASSRQWIFILMSVFGVVVVVLATSGFNFGVHLMGIGALLIAVLAAAVYNILSRKLSSKYTPAEITVVMMVTGAIFFNVCRVLTMKTDQFYFAAFLNISSLVTLLYLGILSSVAAFFLVNYMLNRMPASQTATFINLTTVVSVVAGVVFRGESFGVFSFIGGLLILAGVWGANANAGRN